MKRLGRNVPASEEMSLRKHSSSRTNGASEKIKHNGNGKLINLTHIENSLNNHLFQIL